MACWRFWARAACYGAVLVFTVSLTGMVPVMLFSLSSLDGGPLATVWWDPTSNAKVPHTIHDHIYFSAYDGRSMYTNRGMTNGANMRPAIKLEKKLFNQVTEEVTMYLNDQGHHKFSRDHCQDVRYRDIPSIGVEVDMVCSNPASTRIERVTLVKPLEASQVTLHTSVSKNERINIIMPLRGRLEALQLFLTNLKQIMAVSKTQLGLTVVYFDDADTHKVQAALQAIDDIPSLQTQFILIKQRKFSRSKALKVGVEKSKIDASIVFLCDVDALFTSEFFTRCLATPVEGQQVFFPMVFSQYNPEMVFTLNGKEVPSPLQTLSINEHSGYWRVWGHGMVCLYKSDFKKIRGFNPKRNGWGGEDLQFLQRTSKMKYKIVRSIDPGLFHHYHPKYCKDLGKGQKWPCRRLQALGEASNLDFGLWYFRHEYNTSMWGVLKEEKQWERQAAEEWREVTVKEETQIQQATTQPHKHQQQFYRPSSQQLVHDMTLKMALMSAVALNILLSCCLCCRSVLPIWLRRGL